MPTAVAVVLADLAAVFASAGVRWYVFGAQAVIAAGVIRTTLDIDVTVEVPRSGPLTLLDGLRRGGFVMKNVGDVTTFIAETRIIPVRHEACGISVDVVLAGPGLEEEIMGRVRMRKVGGKPVPFIDTVDLVALKVLAGRPKDLEDVRSLVRARIPELSLDLARRRVSELGYMVDDSTLARTLERIISDESETPRKSVKSKPGPRGRASRRPRRR